MQTQKKYIEFRQKRTFDQVLNATFVFLRYNFKRFFQSFFAIGGPIILVSGILYGMIFFAQMGIIFGDLGAGSGGGLEPVTGLYGLGDLGIPIVLLAVAVLMFGYILLSGAVYEFMALYQEQGSSENITPQAVWQRLKGDIGRLTTSTFLFILLFGGAVLIIA
ncbi:MAG TPA: hypothetical protein VEC36_01830, partial [Patescibacteria group bacterium]|nr:hypothetical protein [Patescibacteria group bacterium]